MGEFMKLIHYSSHKDLTCIDPEYMGTGTPSQECRQSIPITKRSYWYIEDSQPEVLVKSHSPYKYTVEIDESKIYNLAEGFSTLKEIKDVGFIGFRNSECSLPNVIALFYKVNVEIEK
jgi:hypothetical protein